MANHRLKRSHARYFETWLNYWNIKKKQFNNIDNFKTFFLRKTIACVDIKKEDVASQDIIELHMMDS